LTLAPPLRVRTTSMFPMHQSVCATPLTVFVPKSANDAPTASPCRAGIPADVIVEVNRVSPEMVT
jgi:hypothetical protein